MKTNKLTTFTAKKKKKKKKKKIDGNFIKLHRIQYCNTFEALVEVWESLKRKKHILSRKKKKMKTHIKNKTSLQYFYLFQRQTVYKVIVLAT